jgi:hypothetical protein
MSAMRSPSASLRRNRTTAGATEPGSNGPVYADAAAVTAPAASLRSTTATSDSTGVVSR